VVSQKSTATFSTKLEDRKVPWFAERVDAQTTDDVQPGKIAGRREHDASVVFRNMTNTHGEDIRQSLPTVSEAKRVRNPRQPGTKAS
jgi:hypothetical protein